MRGLAPRQLAVLTFIRDHMTAEGMPPTIAEIGSHLGIASTNGVYDHLRALEKKGLLERAGEKKARGWRPTTAPIEVESLGPLGLAHAANDAAIAQVSIAPQDAIDVGEHLRALARISPVSVRDAMTRVGSQLASAGRLAKSGAR